MIVRFASVSDVREFVGLATLQPYAIDVVDGEHVVSAKNFMELFTIKARVTAGDIGGIEDTIGAVIATCIGLLVFTVILNLLLLGISYERDS